MCDAYVIDSVRRRMLFRRDFLGPGLAAAGGAAVAPSSAAAVGLTHTLHEIFLAFGGSSRIIALV